MYPNFLQANNNKTELLVIGNEVWRKCIAPYLESLSLKTISWVKNLLSMFESVLCLNK